MGWTVARRTPLVLGLIVAALTLGSPGASTPTANIATSQAFAIRVTVPGVGGQTTGYVSAPKDSVAFGGGYAYPADGSLVTTGSVTSSAGADPSQTSTATASAEVSSISIFGGEIEIGTVSAKVRASAGPPGSSGDFPAPGSRIGGSAVAANTASEWASFGVGGTSGGPADTESTKAWRGSGTGFVVRLTADHNGYPAERRSSSPMWRRTSPPRSSKRLRHRRRRPSRPPGFAHGPGGDGRRREGEETPKPPGPARSRAERPCRTSTWNRRRAAHVFPVYGPASYANTFGAGRADVGWHHGEDIFAAARRAGAGGRGRDGLLRRLEPNRRLASLARRPARQPVLLRAPLAFAPAAFNGNRVKAGLLGARLRRQHRCCYAQGTPYHLHFEIHPVELLSMGYDGVISPYAWLEAVRRLQDVRFSNSGAWVPGRRVQGRIFAPQPGRSCFRCRTSPRRRADLGLPPGGPRRSRTKATACSSAASGHRRSAPPVLDRG